MQMNYQSYYCLLCPSDLLYSATLLPYFPLLLDDRVVLGSVREPPLRAVDR
jgi:hypothetical protein